MNPLMNFLRLRFGRLWKEDVKTLRMQMLLNQAVTSQLFAKMTPQEKLLSLCRLIEIFRTDYGFTPKSFERQVKSLNIKLNRDMAKLWEQSYTQYFDSIKK